MGRFLRLLMMALIAGITLVGAGSAVSAQDAAVTSHPSHIHVGTCAELDPNPTYPLADVTAVAPDAPVDAVMQGVTTLDVTLDALLASPFAINVHASAEDIATYVACGDIAGPVVDGTLIIAMQPQNDSGLSGVAVFAPGETADQTVVTVYLAPGLAGETSNAGVATDAASPAASGHDMHQAATADEATVSIVDFAFDAETLEVPVGTTVTWTNDGDIMHTATSVDGLWDSDIMNHGDTFSFTFTEAGSFDYLCSLHPNMVGTIVVTDS